MWDPVEMMSVMRVMMMPFDPNHEVNSSGGMLWDVSVDSGERE